ncbi:hypothetical protein DL95DRAFT_397438, partial [Leptodontidium sp. 2 PMI_412]
MRLCCGQRGWQALRRRRKRGSRGREQHRRLKGSGGGLACMGSGHVCMPRPTVGRVDALGSIQLAVVAWELGRRTTAELAEHANEFRGTVALG